MSVRESLPLLAPMPTLITLRSSVFYSLLHVPVPHFFMNSSSKISQNGELQKSAGDRWGEAHESVGGMIGIELVSNKGNVVCDFNCGGMFRAWTEEDGEEKSRIFRKDRYESGPMRWG